MKMVELTIVLVNRSSQPIHRDPEQVHIGIHCAPWLPCVGGPYKGSTAIAASKLLVRHGCCYEIRRADRYRMSLIRPSGSEIYYNNRLSSELLRLCMRVKIIHEALNKVLIHTCSK